MTDQGAQIVDLGDDMPPALIKRADGGSLYITRDLAAVLLEKKIIVLLRCFMLLEMNKSFILSN